MPNLDPSVLPIATAATLGLVKAGAGTAVAADGTLTNAGVTSVTAGAGISVSANTGGVTITNTATSTSGTVAQQLSVYTSESYTATVAQPAGTNSRLSATVTSGQKLNVQIFTTGGNQGGSNITGSLAYSTNGGSTWTIAIALLGGYVPSASGFGGYVLTGVTGTVTFAVAVNIGSSVAVTFSTVALFVTVTN